MGTFWLLKSPWPGHPYAPLPCMPDYLTNAPIYSLGDGQFSGQFLVDDTQVDYAAEAQQHAAMDAAARALGLASGAESTETGGDGGSTFNAYDFPSNSLYLEITGMSSNLHSAYLTLHGTQPGQVYELMSKLQLTNAVWSPEQAVHAATNQDWTLATIPVLDRTNSLYLWCRLWTTNDENGNGLPDWWEWENFGSLNEPANADYDADGVNDLQEYIAGTDPNTLDFTFVPAAQYVSNRWVAIQIAVTKGVPSSMAVLVDSTNFSAATWASYNPNATADLGTTEGWHQLWVGLRGRMPSSQQTWQTARVKLDLTPPVIVVTNPTSTLVSRPMIQLQGFCTEALSSLSYDLIPMAAPEQALSNEVALITGQHFDTNHWELSTNYWQAFDVRLTSGTNTVILHATDLAGNTASTNLVLVLDTSAITNPPAITIDWPKDGARVGTDTFTWRGHVDDSTVQVYAQWVEANGTTNVANGRIGRDGDFWIDDLPLLAGTNAFSLVATGATGRSSTAEISVVRSDVDLTIDALELDTLGRDTVWFFVAGTVGAAGYAVSVNGQPAEVMEINSEFWWFADVKLDLAHTHVQVCATPSEPGDDTSAETDWDPAEWVYTDWYRLQTHYETQDGAWWGAGWYDASFDWEERAGGSGSYHAEFRNYYADDHYVWPASDWRWPALAAGTLDGYPITSLALGGGASWPVALGEQSDFDYVSPDGGTIWNRHESGGLVLLTGGKPGSTGSAIFELYGDVRPYPPTDLYVAGLGPLDTNGARVVRLPLRQVVRLDPRLATGANSYWPSMSASRPNWISECEATTPGDRSRTNLGVGERVILRWNPYPQQWPAYSCQGGGSLTKIYDTRWIFTAPSNAATVTITATFTTGVKERKVFNVVEPERYDRPQTRIVETKGYPVGQASVWAHFLVVFFPTNVSFYRLQVEEVGKDADNVWGYFTTFSTNSLSHKNHGADTWIPVLQDNSWSPWAGGDQGRDYVKEENLPSPWSAGGYNWDIPVKWKIGDGPINTNMSGWNQTVEIDASGTLKISKFYRYVQRTTSNVITNN